MTQRPHRTGPLSACRSAPARKTRRLPGPSKMDSADVSGGPGEPGGKLVLPDRSGLVFVTPGQPRIPPELGECALAPREPFVPPMPRPGWSHQLAFIALAPSSLAVFWRFSSFCHEGEFLPLPVGFFGVGLCSVCLLVCRLKPDYCSG